MAQTETDSEPVQGFQCRDGGPESPPGPPEGSGRGWAPAPVWGQGSGPWMGQLGNAAQSLAPAIRAGGPLGPSAPLSLTPASQGPNTGTFTASPEGPIGQPEWRFVPASNQTYGFPEACPWLSLQGDLHIPGSLVKYPVA